MAELVCNVPVPKTPQEIEHALHQYRIGNLSGNELFCHWQAIRDASLNYESSVDDGLRPSSEAVQVPGEDSY